ncbi:recombinase family protein [Vallitalea guaymasensis]|uniref:Recombinase family protein n=1 Tax=Vallitalea guaymasensis TaxID=1185412 RepID=A0A8J8M8F2_9FIRM|nr:recombinase family protein [Vallitalea guaymasensis]QUH28257.1 recombinase family protein [Vallitalea guaymasensis]
MSANLEKRVACYVRVSTENQLENYSIDEQTDRLKAFCKAKDLSIVKFYTDGGYSGGNMNRPGLQQMLKDIKDKHIDMIIVYKLDRLSRSQKDTLTLIEDEFLSNDVDFVSMSENFDTSTPFGKAMIGILSVFAQLEKDQITERFTMGRIGRAKNGYYHGGPTAPTGYDYIDGELVVNEYEALQVKEVFKRFLDGQSINAIRKYMSEHYTNKYGNWSSHTLVLNILKNKVYIGKVKFKGKAYAGKHKPIISTDIFNDVQKILTSTKREDSKTIFQKNPFKANNLLTSLIYCKNCGARFCGNHGNYVCYSRGKTDKRKIIDPNCKNKKWNIQALDKIIKDEILEAALNKEYFNKIISNKEIVPVDNTKKMKKRIDEIDKQIVRMMDLYQVGDIPIEQISHRIVKLKKEKDTISDQLVDKKQTKLSIAEAKGILSRAAIILENGDLSQQRMVVSNLIDYIEIDDECIQIHWSFV